MPAAQEVNNYEDDRSNSEVDSDFENDPVVRDARNSTEVADHDREILVEEEEREKLLANGGRQNDPAPRGFFTRKQEKESPSQTDIKESRRKARRSRKRRKHGRHGSHDEEGELMFEMEEGGPTDDTSSHASSSSAELDKLNRPRSSISKVRLQTNLMAWLTILLHSVKNLLCGTLLRLQ